MSSKPDSTPALPSPWPEFLEELDKLLSSAVELRCLGGFVLMALYGLPRPTGDIDYISAVPIRRERDHPGNCRSRYKVGAEV